MANESEQAEILERIAALEHERAALVAERDTLRGEVALREAIAAPPHTIGNAPSAPRPKSNTALWIVAGLMVLFTASCLRAERANQEAAEAAHSL